MTNAPGAFHGVAGPGTGPADVPLTYSVAVLAPESYTAARCVHVPTDTAEVGECTTAAPGLVPSKTGSTKFQHVHVGSYWSWKPDEWTPSWPRTDAYWVLVS